ncbi:hypothetical protein [Labrys monachus]|uniref:Uncharacterized protein n=1 Tax=Labrys monachus TaxID=217067 RepID=A0ABU0F752_9HYPH|nr:hypothetical protein [Labrys monachus]MDQ0390443.1 hypothetical protein [Labrys monachus]
MHSRLAGLLVTGLIVLNTPAIAAEGRARDSADPSEIAERTRSFEQDLTGFGLPAGLTCSSLVEVLSDAGGQDQSFGGICAMRLRGKKPATIMLCNDTTVGRLTIKAYGFTEDKSDLVNFTAANCPAGG